MPTHDISKPVDGLLGPGLGQPVESGGKPRQPISGDSDQYRDALNRSLSAADSEQPTPANRDSAPVEAPEKPDKAAPSTRPAADDGEQVPAENHIHADGATVDRSQPDESVELASIPILAEVDPLTAEANVGRAQAAEGSAPAGLRLIVSEPDVPVITLSDDAPPQPPVNIHLLLDDGPGVSGSDAANDSTEFEIGEPFSPPAGLFDAPNATEVGDVGVTDDVVSPIPDPHITLESSQIVADRKALDLPNQSDGSNPNAGPNTVQGEQIAVTPEIVPVAALAGDSEVPGEAAALPVRKPDGSADQSPRLFIERPTGATVASVEESGREAIDRSSSPTVTAGSRPANQPIGSVPSAGGSLNAAAANVVVDQGSTASEASAETVRTVASVKSESTPVAGSTVGAATASLPVSAKSDATPAQQTGIPAGVDPAEFVDRVASAVRSAQQNRGQLRARLHPPELGTLQIEVTARDGMLSIRLQVSRAAAQQVLVENMPLLHDALAQSGAQIDRIDVQLNANASDDGSSEQEGQAEHDSRQSPTGGQQQQGAEEEAADDNRQARQNSDDGDMDQLDIQV